MNIRLSIQTLAIGMLLAASLQAHSATTDLAPAPLITDPTASVLPNVFFILDDSLTMEEDFMPNEASDFAAGKYGVASNQCNGIFYDPTTRYYAPVDSTGTSYANSTFTAAWRNGFNTAAGTVNLSTSFVDADTTYRSTDVAQTAFYYVYSGFQSTASQQNYYNTSSVFYRECNSTVGSTTAVDGTHPVNTLFTKYVVSSATSSYPKASTRTDCAGTTCTFSEESQNFANWYSYYRTRMLTMKTSAGLAFKPIGDSFRVGYATINNNTGSDFIGLSRFDPTQKAAWYSKLYNATASFGSPLRDALAKAGKMYANKLPTFNGTTVVDPIQYSCQQNFTILTSDGSWNGVATTQLNGSTAIGNQDGSVPRPQYDGTYQLKSTSQTTATQTQQVQSTSQQQKWTEQNQSQTSNLQSRTGALQWQTNQQSLDSTLQWTTNLQSTTNTLQWQTNLQSTTNTLQWQTNLQHTDAPLQWKTDLQQTIQQQLWSTDQQRTVAQLQWQTKQQITTAPLLWATKNQITTAALQWQTNLQSTKGTLQKQTSQLQKQTTQLQKRTSTLQQQTSQVQSSTSSLQSSTMYLQTRTSFNSGGTWGAWADTTSCTWTQQVDGFYRQCQYVTATGGSTVWTAGGGTWSNAASCTTNFSTTTTAGTTWPSNGTSCRYTAFTGYANAASCTALAQSSSSPYVVGTATQCQTIVSSAYANAASCTATTVPNGSGQTTQCQYTAWTSFAGSSTCSAQPQSTSPNYTVATATECQSPVTSAYANATSCTATTTPDGSGNTTQCQYLAYTAFANVGASGTCTVAAQSTSPNYTVGVATNCQLTGTTTAYVTNPPACTVTYTAGTGGTADASGISISACSNTGSTYSGFANVGGTGTCTTVTGTGPAGSSTQCQMATATPAYLAYAATCTNTYNAGGASTATGGNVVTCSTAGTFSGTTTLTGSQSCVASANVQCTTGTGTTAYATFASPTCTVTFNSSGTSTASSGLVVSACPVTADWSASPITNLTNGQVCTGGGNIQCSTATGTTAYVTYAIASANSCAVTFNGASGTSTAGAGGLVTTACPTTTFSTPASIASCTNSTHVVCSLGTGVTDYIATYPPTCTTGNPGTGLVVTACTLNASFGPANNIAASGSCTGGVLGTAGVGNTWGRTVQCLTGTALTPAYVTTYPPTCASVTVVANGTYTANASGNVITACPNTGTTYGTATSVGASGVCDGTVANVKCIATAGATTARVTTYPPTCATTFNAAGSNTANASGTVITACPTTTYGGATTVAASGSCNGTLANVQCIATAGTATARITTYPPTCTTNFNAAGTSTANASSTVITACPTTTYGGATNVGANGTCDGTLANVNCATTGGTATLVATYPPTCAATYNGATASNTANASGTVRSCPTTTFGTTWTNTTAGNVSCTPSSTVNCQYNWGTYTNAASCTTNFSANSAGVPMTVLSGTSCQYTAYTAYADLAAVSCTPVSPSPSSPYTVSVARNCQVINANTTPANTPAWPVQAYVGAASCTPTSGVFNTSGQRISCQTATTGPTVVDSCTSASAAAGNSYTSTSCVTNTTVPAYGVASCTQTAASSANGHTTTSCNTVTTSSIPAVNCVDSIATAANSYTATTCSAPLGGTYDTLADVAQYYYMTDLRTTALGNSTSGSVETNGADASTNNVFTSDADTASYQHMTTFTLGLGARGRMVFDPNYSTATSGDYYSVAQGVTADGTTTCSWQAAGTTCNWPIPAYDTPEDIDDLWHAAVDGRGTYFSAKNPSDLGIGLTSALANIQQRLGSAAAATTSTAFVTQGDNFLFSSSYVSVNWTGELVRQQIDPITGNELATIDWSAQAKLDANISRVIYTYSSGASNHLKLFTYANLTSSEQAYFNLASLATLSQFATTCPTDLVCLNTAAQTSASGANLVNYITGTRTNEGAKSDGTKYYRQRQHVLGDIVDSESAYIKTPTAKYSDAGFGNYQQANSNRRAMVYVGANDGMLHAFRATDDTTTTSINEGGQEDWAYIPSLVMPNLYYLADKKYGSGSGNDHHFYVDGTPVPADICISSCGVEASAVWKTILVGGLNHGGRGYYALDVTDPANPKALWEFTDANMGYTYGNPKVVKLKTGTWVVLVSSGYNNVPPDAPSGDGKGHLYVINAYTGALIRDISTGVGSVTTPSGLAKIEAPVTTPGVDATVIGVYGGDLEGNLWRFDVNGDIGLSSDANAGYDAQLIATLKDAAANPQPITSKPLTTLVDSNIVIYVGTGRYLGSSDQSNNDFQSFYGIKDTYQPGTTPSTAIYSDADFRGSNPTFVQQVQSETSCPSGTSTSICASGQTVTVSTANHVDFSTQNGWFVDFIRAGERDNTDPAIIKGTLVIVTNKPSSSSCSIGGDSYLYQLDYRSGGAVSSSPTGVVGGLLGHEISSRPVVFTLQDGTSHIITQMAGGNRQYTEALKNHYSDGVARRVSWRELLVQ